MPRGVFPRTDEYRAKLSAALSGRTLTPEHKANIGAANKGRPPANTGKHLAPETRAKISNALTGRPLAPDHPKRKPKPAVTYSQLHRRVRRTRGNATDYLCAGCCQGRADEWATIHGREGLDIYLDYVPLCRHCHCEYDQENRTAARRKRMHPQRLDWT